MHDLSLIAAIMEKTCHVMCPLGLKVGAESWELVAGAEPASVVIGTNEGGVPVFDFNALIAPIGPRQGGQAAGPLPPDVQAAHDARCPT